VPPPAEQSYSARLLMGCADRPGIVAAVSAFLFERGANIVSSQQYSTDPSDGRFFLRTEFFLPEPADHEDFERDFAERVAARLQLDWRLRWWGERQRLAILVSRHDHCLQELLWRWRRGELDADTRAAGVPFHHVPVPRDGKQQAEQEMLELLRGRAELLVLARYMQILSGAFLERVDVPAINIHHSFLPAFAGAEPYRRARERGVKLIGATAHYVTEQLDDGPIIDQDVVRVDHRHSVVELERLGRDVERLVLARAVALHLDDRVIADGRRTIVL